MRGSSEKLTEEGASFWKRNGNDKEKAKMGRLGKSTEVPVRELVPYANNARLHTGEQVEKIAKSIAEFGFLNPVLIDKDKNVIAGHGRILAAKKLGMKTVPVLYVEGLTEEQRRAYVLADNRLTELGGVPYALIVEKARQYIKETGGFEKFAEWGLV